MRRAKRKKRKERKSRRKTNGDGYPAG